MMLPDEEVIADVVGDEADADAREVRRMYEDHARGGALGDEDKNPLNQERAGDNHMKSEEMHQEAARLSVAEREVMVEKEIGEYCRLAADDDGSARSHEVQPDAKDFKNNRLYQDAGDAHQADPEEPAAQKRLRVGKYLLHVLYYTASMPYDVNIVFS